MPNKRLDIHRPALLMLAFTAFSAEIVAADPPEFAAAADPWPVSAAHDTPGTMRYAENRAESAPHDAVPRTTSHAVLDVRHETRIQTAYLLNPYLRSYDLVVAVHEGKATLTGIVDEAVNRELAGELASGVEGITDVDNDIEVRADHVAVRNSSERSYGEVADDATISATIKSKLDWSKQADALHAEVDTHRGHVTLTGTAENSEASDLAATLARDTRGVASVTNEISLGKAEPSTMDKLESGAAEVGNDLSDAWITTKVKSTLLYSGNVDGTDISVATNNGVVTLEGRLGSGAERSLAIELARNVRGVKKVEAADLVL